MNTGRINQVARERTNAPATDRKGAANRLVARPGIDSWTRTPTPGHRATQKANASDSEQAARTTRPFQGASEPRA
jgi:hypothetical protein